MAAGFGIFFLLRTPVAAHPVHRRAVLPWRPVAQPARRPRGRDRRAAGRRRGRPAGAAPGAHLPARRRPPGNAEAAARLADGAAAGWPRRARLLGRTRPPGLDQRTGPGVRVQLRAHHRRPVHRGPVAHHGRGAGHGPVDQPPRHADRRPPPRRRPEGRLPRRQRPGARAVHHHRGRGGDHHAGRQGPHQVRQRHGIARADRSGIGVEAGGPQHSRDRTEAPRARACRTRRAAHRTAERDPRRPGGARGPRGPGADHPGEVSRPRRQPVRPPHPDSGRRGLVRAARDRSRPWPLPGRGDSGGVPGGRVQRPPGPERRRVHLAGREPPGRAAGHPRRGRHRRADGRRHASGRAGEDAA